MLFRSGQERSIIFPGKIKAAADVNLAFRVSGTIQRMPVEVGSFVKSGQLLAALDPRDYEIQLAATEAEYNRIKAETERIAVLYEKKSISANNYDKASYALQQIEAKYNAHKNALKDTRLYAPYDCYVQRRHFDINETVGAGTPVVSTISTAIPEVEIFIPSSDYIRQNNFDIFSCTSEIYPDISYPLEVVGIAQKANMSQLFNMRLRFKKDNYKELPPVGMTVSVTLCYKEKESSFTSIPRSAVFREDNQSKVWIYNEMTKTVTARTIQLSEIKSDGYVIVEDGLQPGEEVVSAGVHSLKEGQSARKLPKVSKTNAGGLL